MQTDPHHSRFRRTLRLPLLVAGLAAAFAGGAVLAETRHHAEPASLSGPSGQYAALTDEHLKHLVHDLMGRVDDAQKARIVAIAHRAKPELDRLEQRAREARAPRRDVLLADRIDRQRLERIRAAEMAVAEERSHRVDQVLVELASVMTPQQRARFLADLRAPAH